MVFFYRISFLYYQPGYFPALLIVSQKNLLVSSFHNFGHLNYLHGGFTIANLTTGSLHSLFCFTFLL